MGFRTLRSTCALAGFVCLLVLGAASGAAADTIMLEWDPSGGLVGYKVHVGPQSGTYTEHFDVGSQTTFTFPTAIAGQRYCFAVSSYLLSSLLEGPNSGEVCGYSNEPPTLMNPGNRTSTVGQAVTLQLVGSDPDSQPVTYSATGLPPGLSLMASTGYISGAGTTVGSYSVTVRADDNVLTASQTFTWVMSAATGDTTRPTASISTPTTGTTWSTTSATMAMSGAAADNVGVTQVRWSSDRGGSGVATGTTSWSISEVPLLNGANVITVTAVDAAGNQGTDALTVTYTGTTSDTTLPTVSISTPTSNTYYSAYASTVGLGGAAADNVGVTQVRWSNDRGGSGVATGTTNWSIAALSLLAGANGITITAVDAAGNQATDFISVYYNVPASDTTQPTASISAPTNGTTWSTTSATLAMSGAAADNVGVTQVRWSSDRGGSGVATGTTSWSIAGLPLQSGANVITVTAVDAAGNTGADALTVTYTVTTADTTRPTASISAPTTGTTWSTTSATMAMSGTAADNVGVTQVRWSNDRGGSGVATGTTGWSVSGVALQSGANVFIITAVDAAGNQGTDSVTVTRTVSTADTTVPTVSISTPTTNTYYSAYAPTVGLGGAAADNVGVTQIRWSNDRGGSGVATGTTSWSIAALSLLAGANGITITAVDAAGNQATDFISVFYNVPTGDTTRPTASISTPTTGTTWSTTSATMAMSGQAADNVGVTQVRWSNDRGGSGVATGTTGWSVSGVALQSGANVITVTAVDAAGNQGTDYVTVTRTVTTTDTTVPTVSIRTPTSNTYYSAYASTVGVGGVASDNVGVTQVRWSNDRGGSGVATGTTSWSIAALPLLAGANGITITAVDAAGNQATDFISVFYNVPTTTATLNATLRKNRSVRLTWANAQWPSVDVYRNGMFLTSTNNDGTHTDPVFGSGTVSYRICAPGSTTTCSNIATVSF